MQTRRAFFESSLAGGAFLFGGWSNASRSKTVGGAPTRFVFLTKSNGLFPYLLAPPTLNARDRASDRDKKPMQVDLKNHDLPEWMSVLEKHKKDMAIVQGLSAKGMACSHDGRQSCLGMFKANKNLSSIKWATADVELGRLYPSPFGHVEVQTVGRNRGIVAGRAAIGKMKRNYAYADPETAYNELFKTALGGSQKSLDVEGHLLGYLNDLASKNYNDVRGIERIKMTSYQATVEQIQHRDRQLEDLSPQITKYLPRLGEERFSEGATTAVRQQAFAEIILAALQAGLTNSALFSLDTLGTPYNGLPELGDGRINLHSLGHKKGLNGEPELVVRSWIRQHHMRLIDTIADGLKSTAEGSGTMFDNTVIVYQAENGEAHHSNGSEQPILMLAGKNTKMNFLGNYMRLPGYGQAGHKTLGNWYTTHLNNHGNPIEHYGQFDLELNQHGIDQKGPIKEFLV